MMTSTQATDGDHTASDVAEGAPAVVEAPRKPRAARRIPTSDVVLEAAADRARAGLLEVVPEAQVGRHVSAVIDGERLVTHRFEAFVPGYTGWQWYVTVARVARSKEVTVCEVGLLPSAASLTAPEWLPWSERVRPEDSQPDGEGNPQQADPVEDTAAIEDIAAVDAPVVIAVDPAATDGAPVDIDEAAEGDTDVTDDGNLNDNGNDTAADTDDDVSRPTDG